MKRKNKDRPPIPWCPLRNMECTPNCMWMTSRLMKIEDKVEEIPDCAFVTLVKLVDFLVRQLAKPDRKILNPFEMIKDKLKT